MNRKEEKFQSGRKSQTPGIEIHINNVISKSRYPVLIGLTEGSLCAQIKANPTFEFSKLNKLFQRFVSDFSFKKKVILYA